uniref:LIM zinc-binding domain-containing protein n=1 Tax=Meloidogyne hapla TaxID=6305 RepID=A0A1I8BPX9_MELHA
MNDQNINNNIINNSIPLKSTTIQISTNPVIKKQLSSHKREIAKQQCAFLTPEANNDQDGKQFISKDESDMLRDSILQLNRPRINRPPWEIMEQLITQPAHNNKEIYKKDEEEDSSKTGTTFIVRSSNSSTSGCSSNPQSGSCSPIVFNSGNFTTKTTTKSFTFAHENGFDNGVNEINIKEQLGKLQQNVEEEEQKMKEWAFSANEGSSNAPTKIISASLIQNALLKSGTNNIVNTKHNQKLPQSSPTIATTSSHSTTSSTSSNSSSYSRSPIYSKNSPLKRKEFSESRRQILQTQKNEEEQQRSLQKAKEAMRWQQQRAVDTVEEVSQLGRAALEQMAILEELEFEDLERKTKISDRLSVNKHAPASSSYVSLPLANGYNINKNIAIPTSCSTSSIPSSTSNSHQESQITANQNKKQNIVSPLQNKLEEKTPPQQLPKQKKKLHAPILDKNKLLLENKINTTDNSIINSSQHPLKSLATSIIRYDDEKREKEQIEKLKIKSPTHQTSPEPSAQSPSSLLECKTCGKAITNVVLQALGASFHPACFRCRQCSRCLDGIPFTVEQNGEGVICMDDYERYFVTHCRACKKPINAVNVNIMEGCGMQLSNEDRNRCYPIQEHLLCRRCHTLWRRMGALETEAAVSDL